MEEEYIRYAYQVRDKAVRLGYLGKKKLTAWQCDILPDVVNDLLLEWMERGRGFETLKDFKNYFYFCLWHTLQKIPFNATNKFGRRYSRMLFSESFEEGFGTFMETLGFSEKEEDVYDEYDTDSAFD